MQALLAQLTPEPGDASANVATVARILEEHPEAELADARSDLDYLLQVRSDLPVRSDALAQTQGGRT